VQAALAAQPQPPEAEAVAPDVAALRLAEPVALPLRQASPSVAERR
jgi:hypothetical protein